MLTRCVPLLVAAMLLVVSLSASAADLGDTLKQLDTRNFRKKLEVAETIAQSGSPRASAVLTALQHGNLYFTKADGRPVIRTDRNGPVLDAVTGDPVADAGSLDKVIINNLMRVKLRDLIARLDLTSPDASVRLAAARALYGDLDEDGVARVQGLIEKEPDDDVRHALQTAVALAHLKTGDAAAKLAAMDQLAGSLESEVRNELRAAAANDGNAEQVRQKAQDTLASIDRSVSFYQLIEQIFFGLSLGSVLLLAAIGLAITFGVMGVINMAHGELIMLGAYTTYVVQQLMPDHIGLSLFVSVPAAFLVGGAFGVAIERTVIRFLYGRPLETLLATFGLSLILQQMVRTVFSPLNRSVITPDWMSGSYVINPVLSITANRLVVVAFALIVFFGLVLVLKRTNLGLRVRAVAQNRAMARAVGVRSEWVDAMTFGLGSGIAGMAGVALSQLTNVGPNLGQSYIIDSFLVVVFGGVGNLLGTLTGALTLGVANKFLEPYAGAVLAKILVLVFIILFIQKRPRGLFPQRGRAAEG
ncbi:MAG TPA: urea ABC transporter permease subunit UrtB [Gammaproteobacteria bacterium]|nr:urea ABC transporter permease subunit UrtB [Gammaproteobacteria bacterium]